MDLAVVTLFIMFLLSFPIFGCKAQDPNFAPSWMGSFQRGPETAGTLFGLPSPSPPTPTGPLPAEPQPSTTPQPSDPQPSTTPPPSDPVEPHAAGPNASQPLSLPRPLGPPVARAPSPDSGPHDCEKAYCSPVHAGAQVPDHPDDPAVTGPLSQEIPV